MAQRRRRIVDVLLAHFDGCVVDVAEAGGLTRQAVYRWFMPDMGYVPNRNVALKISAALHAKGIDMSAAQLMGIEPKPVAESMKRASA